MQINIAQARLYRVPAVGNSEPVGDALPSLAEMQAFVGGYVEHVRAKVKGRQFHLFVNENARAMDLPPNVVASALYTASFNPDELRQAIALDASVVDGLTIRGNVWLWHGRLPVGA